MMRPPARCGTTSGLESPSPNQMRLRRTQRRTTQQTTVQRPIKSRIADDALADHPGSAPLDAGSNHLKAYVKDKQAVARQVRGARALAPTARGGGPGLRLP
jgi:hypothetical protein